MDIKILPLEAGMLVELVDFLNRHGVSRSREYFERCLEEQNSGSRCTLIAFAGECPAGTVHLLDNSLYPGFNLSGVPEINDLVVVKAYQRQGIGEKLVKACEELARKRGCPAIGLGVGLYKDYGSAQRLYFRLGYKPDGKGLMYRNEPVVPGTWAFVDDDLLLYLVKDLKES